MPLNDPIQGLTILPDYTQTPDIPAALLALWLASIQRGVPRFATTAERDTAYPSPVAGQHAWVVDRLYVYTTADGWVRSMSVPSAWSTADITLASDWTQTDTFSTRDMAVRLEGTMAVLTGGMLNRVNTGLAVSAGVGFDLLTLTTSYRPPTLTYLGAGTIGVAGTLGTCGMWINTSGVLQIIPLVANGTIATTGQFGNHVGLPTLRWRVS